MNKFMFYVTMPFRKSYWIMNEKYNHQWDLLINKLAGSNKFIVDERDILLNNTIYTCRLGNETIWLSNYPYSCFTSYNDNTSTKGSVRPSRYTIYKLAIKLKKDIGIDLINAKESYGGIKYGA